MLAPRKFCIYVGDDRRDVEAGRSAQMSTLAAGWGYLGRDRIGRMTGMPTHVLAHPDELLNLAGNGLNFVNLGRCFDAGSESMQGMPSTSRS